MKPQKISFDEPDKLEVVQQIPVKSEKLVGKITPFKGHTLFEINCSTGEIIPATYEEISVGFKSAAAKKKVLTKENCLYISCLNIKSAKKKYFKWLIEKTMEQKFSK